MTENEDEKTSNKKKFITKVALAKKILKKKIVPNKKTMFDDEGQVRILYYELLHIILYNVNLWFIILLYNFEISKSWTYLSILIFFQVFFFNHLSAYENIYVPGIN